MRSLARGYHRGCHAECRGEQQQAMEYLERAGEPFSRCGAKLHLDEAPAKKQIPEGVSSNLQGGAQ